MKPHSAFAKWYLLSDGLLAAPASGADVTLDRYSVAEDSPFFQAYFSFNGPIIGNEMEQVSALIADIPEEILPQAQRFLEVSLNSQGGSFPGGVRLMQLFAENGVATRLRANDECLSACAIAFLGGSTILWDTQESAMRRVVEPGGRLGFHAPSLDVPSDADFDADSVASAYRVALESLGALVQFDFEIPRTLIETIVATPPQDMYVLRTVDDFARWNIELEWDNPGWQPQARDIARMCLQNYVWRHGASFTRAYAVAGLDSAAIEQLVNELAVHVGEFPGGGGMEQGIFTYVHAPQILDRLCIVALRNTTNGWRPNAMGFYTPDVTVSFEDIVRSDNMDIGVRHIDYLPHDTDVFLLR